MVGGETYRVPIRTATQCSGKAKTGHCESCQVDPSVSCHPGHPLCRLESESVWLVTNGLSYQLLYRNIMTHRRDSHYLFLGIFLLGIMVNMVYRKPLPGLCCRPPTTDPPPPFLANCCCSEITPSMHLRSELFRSCSCAGMK